MSSTQYYWTLSNPYVFEARSALGLREISAYRYFGYDDRTMLTTLAAVRYYVLPSGSQPHLPYGFTKVEPAKPVLRQQNADGLSVHMSGRGQASQKYTVYRNSYALPLAYTYDSYLSVGNWKKLTDIEKQEAMLQTLILEKDSYRGPLQETAPNPTGRKVKYTIKCNDENVLIHGRTITVKKPHSTITLKFKGLPKSETYLSVRGMHFKGNKAENVTDGEDEISAEPTQTCLSMRSSAEIKKKLIYYTENHRAYDNRHDFSVNLCYTENAADFVRISFSKAGSYSFDSLDITCQPMKQYTAEIEKRREITLQNITVGKNEVNGTIYLEKPKLLCLAIPFSAGWRAYVDGKETTLYRANIMYMALDVGKGRHSIKLEYHTPLLREGICISILAFVLFGLYPYILRKRV